MGELKYCFDCINNYNEMIKDKYAYVETFDIFDKYFNKLRQWKEVLINKVES